MKFNYLNIKNFFYLVPPWTCDVLSIARSIDGLFATKEGKDMFPRDIYKKLDFWVEVTPGNAETTEIRFCVPENEDQVDWMCGWLIIKGDPIIGASCQVEVPLNEILKGAESISGKHLLYCHTFHTETPLTYFGVTKKEWYVRLSQHISSARNGSHYLFHKAISTHTDVVMLHKVFLCGVNEDTAMGVEEELVDLATLYPMGLNMIPGGYAGVRYIHKLGFNVRNSSERDKVAEDISNKETLKGRPNPLCASRWANDSDFVERVICGHSGRLTAEQVRTIRNLHSFGKEKEEIASLVGANNYRQIQDVVSGKYYARIQ